MRQSNMRKVIIKIPDDYCNDCQFYSTWNPDPEECTGFGGFRRYRCGLLNFKLREDYSKLHQHKRDVFDTNEYKVPVPDQCKKKYK